MEDASNFPGSGLKLNSQLHFSPYLTNLEFGGSWKHTDMWGLVSQTLPFQNHSSPSATPLLRGLGQEVELGESTAPFFWTSRWYLLDMGDARFLTSGNTGMEAGGSW